MSTNQKQVIPEKPNSNAGNSEEVEHCVEQLGVDPPAAGAHPVHQHPLTLEHDCNEKSPISYNFLIILKILNWKNYNGRFNSPFYIPFYIQKFSYHEVYEASHHHEGVQVPCQLQLLLGVSLPEEWCWILL